MIGTTTVSYTHLDVYKRQEPDSSIVVTQRTSGGGKLGSTNTFTYTVDDGDVIEVQ